MSRYRIEEVRQPQKFRDMGFPPEPDQWCIIRNHDDEPISIYQTKWQAEQSLRERVDTLEGERA
jgi:hypothetical protein